MSKEKDVVENSTISAIERDTILRMDSFTRLSKEVNTKNLVQTI